MDSSQLYYVKRHHDGLLELSVSKLADPKLKKAMDKEDRFLWLAPRLRRAGFA